MTAIQRAPTPGFKASGYSATRDQLATVPLRFSNIVFVADLSGESSYALHYAQQLAHQHKAELLLVHAIDPLLYAFPQGAPAALLLADAARKELAEFESHEAEHGTHHSIVERDRVCQDILDVARKHAASLLILGTHGYTSAGRAALGAVARRLVPHTPCPILTVAPGDESEIAKAVVWKNVLAATDFSGAGLSALNCARSVAGQELFVLHSALCGMELECSHCLDRLRFQIRPAESDSLLIEHFVSSGEAGIAIATLAKKLGPDLLVLGAPTQEAKGDIAESTVYQTISQSLCPVLLVPGKEGRSSQTLIEEVAFAC